MELVNLYVRTFSNTYFVVPHLSGAALKCFWGDLIPLHVFLCWFPLFIYGIWYLPLVFWLLV
jgi:hypothetical protein